MVDDLTGFDGLIVDLEGIETNLRTNLLKFIDLVVGLDVDLVNMIYLVTFAYVPETHFNEVEELLIIID